MSVCEKKVQEQEYRIEKDSLGEVKVPKDRLWGAQTQRSLNNFKIGNPQSETLPMEVIKSFALLKQSCAKINNHFGVLKTETNNLISKACDEILTNKITDIEFPLKIWQTGSGTQTNMNINEVISNRCCELINQPKGSKKIHPNDDVNKSQSSNDTFPTVMNIATALEIKNRLIPSLKNFSKTIKLKMSQFYEKNKPIIKLGRTHTMDAVPLTLNQEWSGYYQQIENSIKRIEKTLPFIYELAIGGTAVGTGLNTIEGFSEKVCKDLAEKTKIPFIPSPNKFESLSCNDSLVELHGSLNSYACCLNKIANDIRFYGSGPRCGLGELILPANEPGSSIMPGKVNPTQCEAITMVCCQVMGNNTALTFGGANGHFQLNVFRPLIIHNIIRSIRLLSDATNSFVEKCLIGIKPNHEKIKHYLNQSLMLVTALNPHIGYDNAGKVAKLAFKENLTLKEACLKLKLLNENEFEKLVDPEKMLYPKKLQ